MYFLIVIITFLIIQFSFYELDLSFQWLFLASQRDLTAVLMTTACSTRDMKVFWVKMGGAHSVAFWSFDLYNHNLVQIMVNLVILGYYSWNQFALKFLVFGMNGSFLA